MITSITKRQYDAIRQNLADALQMRKLEVKHFGQVTQDTADLIAKSRAAVKMAEHPSVTITIS